MGTIINHTTIINGDNFVNETISDYVQEHIQIVGLPSSNLMEHEVNGSWTIVIPSTGSKRGWGNYEKRIEDVEVLIDRINNDPRIKYKPEMIQLYSGEAHPYIEVD